MFKTSRFDKLLAKSTSELLMEADWETNLTICDLVRGQEVTPRDAIISLKKKLNPDNPHVLMLGLSVLEALMKNCGTPIHDEVCGTEFVLSLLEFTYQTEEIRCRIFGYIQNWEHAFKSVERYEYLHEAYEEIKRSGHPLPPFHESEAMFSAEVAPNWKDGEECFRCKTAFSTFRRKHHCRNCGNVFCGDCTTGRAGLPKYGIEKEVRVCDACLLELKVLSASGSNGTARKEKPKMHANTTQQQQQREAERLKQKQHQKEAAAKAAKEKELRLKEEEDLQLALALSASEAESKQQIERQAVTLTQPSSQPKLPPSASLFTPTPPSEVNSDMVTEVDPELALYLNRNYWAGRAAANAESTDSYVSGFTPTAPTFPPPTNPDYVPSVVDTSSERGQEMASVEVPPEGSILPGVPALTSPKTEEFLSALKKSLDVFNNRMKVCNQRGRPVSADNTLQTLFRTLHQMNMQLLQYSADLETRRTCLEKVQDQTAQIKEAREALDALRNDYAEQRRREEEEAHRQRQIQMMQKVEHLRQKKRAAIEAQNRQLMEESLASQQLYSQYAGYGHLMYPGMVPPTMMPYGAPHMAPMGYAPTDFYATQQQQQPQQHYDPSLQQQSQQQVQSQTPSQQQGGQQPTNGVTEQHVPTANMAAPVSDDQNLPDSFDFQNMMQAMPAPTQPQVEFTQPGGPPPITSLLDQMPNPPTEKLPVHKTSSSEDSDVDAVTGVRKAPTPQLICLE
nr:hepatocyte growth factor regulated tyrosine [Hymenolepis microstoma]